MKRRGGHNHLGSEKKSRGFAQQTDPLGDPFSQRPVEKIGGSYLKGGNEREGSSRKIHRIEPFVEVHDWYGAKNSSTVKTRPGGRKPPGADGLFLIHIKAL